MKSSALSEMIKVKKVKNSDLNKVDETEAVSAFNCPTLRNKKK